MTNEEKIKVAVQLAMDQILWGRYDAEIFDELSSLDAYINNGDMSFLLKHLPTFNTLSRTEMRKARSLVKKQLKKEINNKEHSFLQIMRIVESLGELAKNFDRVKISNPKAKFCIEIWKQSISDELETISLLDEI